MGEKRWFLIRWDNGIATMVGQPVNDLEKVMTEYKKDPDSLEVCETIYG